MTHSEYQDGAPPMQICSKQIAYDQPDHQRVIRAGTPPIYGLAPAVAGGHVITSRAPRALEANVLHIAEAPEAGPPSGNVFCVGISVAGHQVSALDGPYGQR
jgi:hypothetical protein